MNTTPSHFIIVPLPILYFSHSIPQGSFNHDPPPILRYFSGTSTLPPTIKHKKVLHYGTPPDVYCNILLLKINTMDSSRLNVISASISQFDFTRPLWMELICRNQGLYYWYAEKYLLLLTLWGTKHFSDSVHGLIRFVFPMNF